MKQIIVIFILAVCSIHALGQQTKYVRMNYSSQLAIADSISNSYAPDNKKEAAIYRSIVDEAFKCYFAQDSVQAIVFEEDTIEALNHRLKNQEEKWSKFAATIEDSLLKVKDQNFKRDSQIDSLKITYEENTRYLRDSVSDLLSILQDKTSHLNQLEDSIATLSQSAELMAKISDKLQAKQRTLVSAFRDCCNSQLIYVKGIDDKKKAIASYNEFVSTLELEVPAELQNQMNQIESTCIIAEFCQKAIKTFEEPYNQQSIDYLVKESSMLKPGDLTPMQQTEYQQIVYALQSEFRVIKNFKNGVIGSLLDLGCIPDESVYQEAQERIRSNVSVFTEGDANCNEGYYNNYYTYINKKLDKLKDGVKAWQKNRYDDNKTFENFLKETENSLSK